MKKAKRKLLSLLKKLHKKHKSSYFGEITGEKQIKNSKKTKQVLIIGKTNMF